MTGFEVFGLGELLWDELPNGKRPGGAPANFAYVATQLGDKGAVLSRLGNDEKGKALTAEIKERGVDASLLQVDELLPTGTVKVSVDGEGQPEFNIESPAAWDNLVLSDRWRKAAGNASAVAFGTLAQRSEASRTAVQGFVGSTGPRTLRLLDLNLRQDQFSLDSIEVSLELATVVKLSESELDFLAKILGIERTDASEVLNDLRERYRLDAICLTRGAGSSIVLTATEMSTQEVPGVEVADAVGAGDAFSAGLVHGLLRGWEIDRVNRFAGSVGSYVASRAGAMPDFSEF